MIPHWAVPGAKVVCIDDAIHEEWRQPNVLYLGMGGLCRGTVYTVRRAGIDSLHKLPSIWLVEIARPTISGETGFSLSRFRPLVDHSTDNEVEARIFRALRAPHQEHA